MGAKEPSMNPVHDRRQRAGNAGPIHDRQSRRHAYFPNQDEQTDAYEEQRSRPAHPFHAASNSQLFRYLKNNATDELIPLLSDPLPLSNAAVNYDLNNRSVTYEFEPEVISIDASRSEETQEEIQNDTSDLSNDAEISDQEDQIEINNQTGAKAKDQVESLQVQDKGSAELTEDARKDEQSSMKAGTEKMLAKKTEKEEDEKTEKAKVTEDGVSDKTKDISPKAEPVSGGAADASGETDLNAWKAKVVNAMAAVPKPTLGDMGSRGAKRIAATGRKAGGRLKGKRGALLKSAKAARKKAPDPGKPLPAPPPSPVPEADQKIAEVSNKTLPKQTLPALQQRPAGMPKGFGKPGPMPTLDTNLASDIGTAVSVKPQEKEGHAGPTDVKNPNKRAVDKVKNAAKKEPIEGKHAKAGEVLVLEDTAPKPSLGGEVGTKGISKEKMAGVLAELKRHSEPEADRIVTDARKEAYPGQSLHIQYKTLGDEDLKPQVKTEIENKVESLRKVAGLSAVDIDKAMEERKAGLKKDNKTAKTEIKQVGKGSKEQLQKNAETHADEIAGARNAVDTDTIQQLTAVGGEADPELIKLRRDQATRNLTRRAARQDVYYEQSGERRQKALDAMAKRYSNAYANAAQRDHANHVEYLEKTLIKEGNSKVDAAKQAGERAKTETAPLFKWAALKHREAAKSIAGLRAKTQNTIKQFRQNVKDALTAAREMVRDWARKKISEQESWWDKILNLFKKWAQDAQDDAAAWEEARNQALRDKVVEDFALLDDIQTAAQSGVDTKTYISERGLDETQAMILRKYFEGAGKKGFKPDAIGAVAYGMRMRVRAEKKPKLIETMKSRVMAMEDSEWRKLARIADAEQSPFNVVSIASDLHKAMDQWGTDEDLIYRSIGNLTPLQAKVLRAYYLLRYKISLDQHLADELSGSEKTRAMALLEGNKTLADVAALHEAMHGGLTGLGTDEETIMRVLRGKTGKEREAIIAEYKRRYGRDLKADLKSELADDWSSHHDYKRASALLAGDTAKADAIALDQAMHGGWTGAGTDEAQIARVYEKIRAEVEAQAAANGWSTEQMNAKIAQRNKAVEDAYEVKYAGKKKDGDGKSALKKALESKLSGPELDLAMAFADNDLVKADIARLEVERTSFITDDDVVLKVLESQRTRAEKDVKRDAEYDLHLRADMDLMRGIPWDRKKWASERKDSNERVEKNVKDRSKQYMSNLENAYDEKYSRYGKGGLQVLITFNMSGNDQTKARDLIATGGLLEPSREIFYAVNGPGTKVDELKRILKGKSPKQIRELKEEWKRLYPNEPPLKERILEEVGGRDHQDMQWALEGEPQTLNDKIKRAEERMEYEKNAYWLGGSFSDEERVFMEDEYKHLVAEKERLAAFDAKVKEPVRKAGESEEDFAIRVEEFKSEQAFWKRSFELQEGYFDRAVEDHRTAVDELADTASTVAAIVATVVVIVVASIFTGGTGGAAIIAALASAKVAAAAAAAAAVATIGTKQLLKGSAYSSEEMAVDAVVGVVDAAASYLTAGMGGAFLKTVRQGAKVPRITALIGRSKAATQLAKMAASNKTSTRVFANALAEGIEGVASTLPSALTGSVLREENWAKGNPFTNILTGTLIETSIGVGLSGGLGALGGLGKHVGDVAEAVPANRAALTDQLAGSGDVLARRGTPADRLAGFKDWQKSNPGKAYKDFLRELDAGLITKEVNETTVKAAQRNMRSELLSGIPPAQRGEFAVVPIDIISDADFYRFTRSESAKAMVIFEDGKPRVILRESADPKVLREEGIHLLQTKDPKIAKKIAQLDETRLANWDHLDLEEKFRLYHNKLDIEIDAQKRLIKSFDDQLAEIDDPALRHRLLPQREAAEKNLRNLSNRLDEVDSLTPQRRMKMASGEIDPPPYLDQKPRLFSKEADAKQQTQIQQRKADDVLEKLPGDADSDRTRKTLARIKDLDPSNYNTILKATDELKNPVDIQRFLVALSDATIHSMQKLQAFRPLLFGVGGYYYLDVVLIRVLKKVTNAVSELRKTVKTKEIANVLELSRFMEKPSDFVKEVANRVSKLKKAERTGYLKELTELSQSSPEKLPALQSAIFISCKKYANPSAFLRSLNTLARSDAPPDILRSLAKRIAGEQTGPHMIDKIATPYIDTINQVLRMTKGNPGRLYGVIEATANAANPLRAARAIIDMLRSGISIRAIECLGIQAKKGSKGGIAEFLEAASLMNELVPDPRIIHNIFTAAASASKGMEFLDNALRIIKARPPGGFAPKNLRKIMQLAAEDPKWINDINHVARKLGNPDINMKKRYDLFDDYNQAISKNPPDRLAISSREQIPEGFPKEIPALDQGFNKWFNDLSDDYFDKIWEIPVLRDDIEARLRHPGGWHEWCLVSQAPIFKKWGITVEQIKEWRTPIKDLEFYSPYGKHGAGGSTTAHNEIISIIRSSDNFNHFKLQLREWAKDRLKGGVKALPLGLQN